jgi:uridine phosphorylase
MEFQVTNETGAQYTQHHIKALDSDIASYVFIPGDHVRGRKMAEKLENMKLVASTRGYFVYTGYYKGTRMTVCSTGMGGPQVAIGMEELGRMGANTFIRVGSAGGMQDDIGVGDIAIATATFRAGGTGNAYLPLNFPASADFEVTRAMVDTAKEMGAHVHVGVCTAGDAFYAPKNDDSRGLLKQAGVICGEMESDTEFIVGHFRHFRCGAAFVMDGGPKAKEIKSRGNVAMNIANHATDPDFLHGEELMLDIALEAMKRVADADKAAGREAK